MLSIVLHSERAIQVNIAIMRAFVQLREMIGSNKGLARRLNELEKKYDSQFRVVFEAIRELMAEPDPKVRRIGFKTKPLERSRSLRTDLTNWADLQGLAEGRTVPKRWSGALRSALTLLAAPLTISTHASHPQAKHRTPRSLSSNLTFSWDHCC
ncbi:MAG TPA: hypothetical protein VIW48_08950 [Nitrospiraceae bacterium]